jgi:SAM-dependent methyltransferase
VTSEHRAGGPPDSGVPTGARAVYDAIAPQYARRFSDELDRKPLDRALLTTVVDLAGGGLIADVGCGPGHVTRFLADRHPDVIGIDLAPGMVALARQAHLGLRFAVGSMLALPVRSRTVAGVAALYSIIHLTADERVRAFDEFARVVRPGGWLLVAFHVESQDVQRGGLHRLTTWFGRDVDLDGYFLDPDDVLAALHPAGFTSFARIDREPIADHEYPSRRCYLLLQRDNR